MEGADTVGLTSTKRNPAMKERMIVSGGNLHQRGASSSKVLDTSTKEACVKDDDKQTERNAACLYHVRSSHHFLV